MKVALHNLGCKVNSYETDAMTQQLETAGYEIVPFSKKADIYIVNTCTVTNMADRKSRQMLHRAKKKNQEAVVVAVGCYVQASKEELLKDEMIDVLVGNNKKSEIVKILEAYFDNKAIDEAYIDINEKCEYEEQTLSTMHEHTRAFIKIQDGCNQFCTYCIIPYTRGRIRSRALKDVVSEVTKLARNGFKEIVLTGIHLGSYGVDLEGDVRLNTVIREVSLIDGIKRVRVGSIEQGIITKEFLEEVSKIEAFCPHFHLSLQSGSQGVLKRMNRHYTPDMYLEKCNLVRSYYENAAITTDVIVGFPGETDEEFIETKNFLEKVKFAEMHVFKYSKRQGTKAAVMKEQVKEEIKNSRSEEIIKLNEMMSEEYTESFIGNRVEVLFEEEVEISGKSYIVGYTKTYVKIGVDKKEIENNNKTTEILNNIYEVLITDRINNQILLAEIEKLY